MRGLLFLVLAVLPWVAGPLCAQESPIRVTTKSAEPFVIKQGDSWTGLSIELWERVVARMGRSTGKYVERPIVGMIDGLKSNEFEVAVGALTVTADREAELDFTHPILTSGLGMAVRATADSGVWAHVKRFFSTEFLEVLGALALVLFVCGTIVWFFERRRNPEEFRGHGFRGIGDGIWWAAVTMTTVGYGDRSPKTFAGKSVALVWMFASLFLIANYTAAIASALTVEQLNGRVEASDLPRVVAGTERGSSASAWLQTQGYGQRQFDTVRDALVALQNGEIRAVVYDKPILRYLARKAFPGSVDVLPDILRSERYAFAVPQGSPLREVINRHILEVTAQPSWIETMRRYLGQ